MKKRLFCFILILVMAFGATAPIYAEAWTSQEAQTVTSSVTGILSMLTQFRTDFVQFMTLTGSGGHGLGATFQDFMLIMSHIDDWIFPRGARGSGIGTLYELLLNEATIVSGYLPYLSHIPNIASYVNNWMNTNNGYLYNIRDGLSNTIGLGLPFSPAMESHTQLFNWDENGNLISTWIDLTYLWGNGQIQTTHGLNWGNGTPLGNIAYILKLINMNQGAEYTYRWAADLTHYNDQLSTWDSQQGSLTQVLFTPDSAIQGLYRYLAFTQRDVARLAFILADPEEQAGMENANASGVSGMYADIYDDQNGGVTLSDLTDTFSTGSQAKQTFNTGISFSPSGLFSFTDDGNWGFWSNAVKNDMDNVPQTRTVYDTSAYDEQLESLYKIWGLDDDK